jgi:hypothetical protein
MAYYGTTPSSVPVLTFNWVTWISLEVLRPCQLNIVLFQVEVVASPCFHFSISAFASPTRLSYAPEDEARRIDMNLI